MIVAKNQREKERPEGSGWMDGGKSVLQGIVIGIANIIPGVSGGTMMVSMGIYDKLIHAITHLFSEWKQSLLFLAPIGLGMVLALVGGAFGIEFLFLHYPVQTTLLFIGLILGGFPPVWAKVKGQKFCLSHALCLLGFFALVAGMAIFGNSEGAAADVRFSLINVILLFFVGLIASATMVIPGVSGSMVLLLLGYYKPIIGSISSFIKAALAMDVPGIMAGIGVLAPFALGMAAGIFLIARLMEVLFSRYPLQAYWSILGLLAASPVAIWVLGDFPAIGWVQILTGLLAFGLGFFVARRLGD